MRFRSFEEALHEDLREDPEFQAAWECTATARAVANAVIRYRVDYQLSQRALAELLGWRQSQVARLEMGEHDPERETLALLNRKLGISFSITSGNPPVRARPGDVVEEAAGRRIVVSLPRKPIARRPGRSRPRGRHHVPM